jgi:bla regulator protein blaR1
VTPSLDRYKLLDAVPRRVIYFKASLLWTIACLAVSNLVAQSPDAPDWQKAAGGKMAFDVASVRPATTPRLPIFPLNNGDAKPPGGRFWASFAIWSYIEFAYKLDVFQWNELRSQLPKWANEDYAIDAKAEGNPTKDQMRLMMQSLLADRFKLKVHFETKEVPVFALTLVHPGKLGPKLIRHSEGPPCPDSFEMFKLPSTTPPPPPPNPKTGDIWPTQCGTSAQVLGTTNGLWIGSRNTTMALLAGDINAYGSTAGEIDKPVVDQTGLEGTFDFILDLPAGSISFFPKAPNPNPSNPDDTVPAPKGTPFLNAVRDQLGLKLVRSRGEVSILIIDHVEKPSEN